MCPRQRLCGTSKWTVEPFIWSEISYSYSYRAKPANHCTESRYSPSVPLADDELLISLVDGCIHHALGDINVDDKVSSEYISKAPFIIIRLREMNLP